MKTLIIIFTLLTSTLAFANTPIDLDFKLDNPNVKRFRERTVTLNGAEMPWLKGDYSTSECSVSLGVKKQSKYSRDSVKCLFLRKLINTLLDKKILSKSDFAFDPTETKNSPYFFNLKRTVVIRHNMYGNAGGLGSVGFFMMYPNYKKPSLQVLYKRMADYLGMKRPPVFDDIYPIDLTFVISDAFRDPNFLINVNKEFEKNESSFRLAKIDSSNFEFRVKGSAMYLGLMSGERAVYHIMFGAYRVPFKLYYNSRRR